MTAHMPGAAGLGAELGVDAAGVADAAGPAEEAGLGDELGATFDHVAIAGRRIRDMLPLWRDTLGGKFVVGADNPEVGWRAVRLELSGVWCLELIEPLAGSAFLESFLRRRPEGGMHHVTFLVDDVQAAFERFAARGYEPFGTDREWFQMFVHPRRADGVLLQLMRRVHGRGDDRQESGAGGRVMTVEDVLAGRGYRGTGVSSP
jgi:methylmalonyl-CoA/ethylmalonyl-CoA epimerase